MNDTTVQAIIVLTIAGSFYTITVTVAEALIFVFKKLSTKTVKITNFERRSLIQENKRYYLAESIAKKYGAKDNWNINEDTGELTYRRW